MPATSVISPPSPVVSGTKGQHYDFIQQAVPACLVASSAQRRLALKQTEPTMPAWYEATSATQKDQLKKLLDARCQSLNELEKTLGTIQPIAAFAQPLLEKALADAGYPLDVNRTWLRLYSPVEDDFGIATGGFKVKTFSLLQAALHNFTADETVAGYFDAASGFVSEPDARRLFDRHDTTLTIHVFAELCRTLDLGKQYQEHLNAILHPGETLAEGVLRERCIRYQKDAFAAAACLALLKGDINESDYTLLMRVLAGEQTIMLGAKQVWYRTPCLMDLRLQGCLIIDPCVKNRYGEWLIAYFPDDPEHPIKRYESFNAFRNALTARLTANPERRAERPEATPVTDDQRFFSQFVAYKDRPYYFRRLTELVVDAPPQVFGAQWVRSEWGRLAVKLLSPVLSPLTKVKTEPQPEVRVPITDPNFNINIESINGMWEAVDLWPERFESLRKRLLDDARAQAVPTADIDEATSATRLQHYLNIGLFGVNLLAMAIPPLGSVMAVVMAGQLLYEILEGGIELGKGDREAGWAHITDVVENLAALAAGGVAFHFTVSPFIESLKSVTLPGGKTRLWKPDLSGYVHPRALPDGLRPDPHGLYRIAGERLLVLEGKAYKVRHKPVEDRYVIEHPSRVGAYEPGLAHNGEGAWHQELEQPLTWHGARLMRRLGPIAEGFSEATLEQIRKVSGIDEDVLRRLHLDSESVPAILQVTFRQFRAYDNAMKVAQGIGAGALPDSLCSYVASLAVELPGWPADKAIEAFADRALKGPSVKYGAAHALPADTLRISRDELMTGQLPSRIVTFLDNAQVDRLVGSHIPRDVPTRMDAVQGRLRDRAEQAQTRLMRSIYADLQPQASAAEALIQRDFKGLPTLVVREMLAKLSPAQLSKLNGATRVPLELAEQARGWQQHVRLAQAYEGLYLDAMVNQDTEALVLNTLERLPGWTDNLRLEVREGEFEGPLRASFGPAEASERKVLVRVGEGRYEARNARDEHLHGSDDLYAALQHALPDKHRQAVGLPHVGQGKLLQARIIDNALPRDQLRAVLGMQSQRKPFFRWPQRLTDNRLGYPLSGRGQGQWQRIIEERVRALYPTMNDEQMRGYLQGRVLENDDWLRALEAEYKQFDAVMNQWLVPGPRDRATLRARRKIFETLRDVWRKSGEWDTDLRGRYRGQRIKLENGALGAQLATLPPLPGNFDHVSSIHLPQSGLTDKSVGFLASFPRLRILNLEGNQLTRVPAACADMPFMEGLDLSDNAITLTEQTALHIRDMHRLEWLALQGNPLSRSLDISRMPRLNWLYLAGCGLREWPVGIFGSRRPREFLLDLSSNPLTRIPDVAPGSDRARILARTAVTRELVAPPVVETLRLYIESIGSDPGRRSPPRGSQDSALWMKGLTKEQWTQKQGAWNDVEEAIGSEAFFDELRKLSNNLSRRPEDYQIDLTAKVWRMLEAMAESSDLRKRLFDMALAPTTCVDAGAQLFNAMGFEVLLHEALSLASPELMRLELLDLAKGKARIDELGRIAHSRVSDLLAQGRNFPDYDPAGHLIVHVDAAGQPTRAIDEVEIHLAYVSKLASRLDLPWQTSMFFNEPDVTQQMIESAYTRVRALDSGDLLRDGIIAQPFWKDYLLTTFADEFEHQNRRGEAMIDLYSARKELVDNQGISVEKKALLRSTIDTLMQQLGKTPSQAPMSQQMISDDYDADMVSLGKEGTNLLRTLTDRIMGRTPQNRK